MELKRWELICFRDRYDPAIRHYLERDPYGAIFWGSYSIRVNDWIPPIRNSARSIAEVLGYWIGMAASDGVGGTS